jgi:hypothetical protein
MDAGIFIFIVRLCLGMVFVMSAIPKIAAPTRFVASVARYQLLPGSLTKPFGYVLPYLELGTGALLLVGWRTELASAAALVMLAVFTLAMLLAIVRKQHITCGCFGLLYSEKVGWRSVLRDTVLVGLAISVLVVSDQIVPVFDVVSNGDPWQSSLEVGAVSLSSTVSGLLGYLSIGVTRR